MRLAIALVIVGAGAVAACGDSHVSARSHARLERLLRQEQAAEAIAQAMPPEVHTAMSDKAIAEVEARERRIRELSEQLAALSGKAE